LQIHILFIYKQELGVAELVGEVNFGMKCPQADGFGKFIKNC
jgi:hypothetical protein